MIDDLIFDQMKEIWINLELYFESYEFSNFKRFFHIFSEFVINLSGFFRIKINFYEFY